MENTSPLSEAFFYILLSVREPNHGYGIIQEVREMTDDRVILGPGTLYGAINSLLSKNWIRLYSADTDSRKKKQYLITASGREAFKKEVRRLQELLDNAQYMEE